MRLENSVLMLSVSRLSVMSPKSEQKKNTGESGTKTFRSRLVTIFGVGVVVLAVLSQLAKVTKFLSFLTKFGDVLKTSLLGIPGKLLDLVEVIIATTGPLGFNASRHRIKTSSLIWFS